MKKFCKFLIHDYMDMYPSEEVITFEGADENEITGKAMAWAKEMSQAYYSGGPTSFVGVMNKTEAVDFLTKMFKKSLMDTVWPDSENIEEALKIASRDNIEDFFDCYGRDRSKSN